MFSKHKNFVDYVMLSLWEIGAKNDNFQTLSLYIKLVENLKIKEDK